LDGAGYGGIQDKISIQAAKEEWAKVDIILLVCNANQAARDNDLSSNLNKVREYFQTEVKNQAMPVVIVVATHIDQLRPIQVDGILHLMLITRQTTKEKNIRAVCEVIAKDLSLPLRSCRSRLCK
jgi:hypothetical protein